MSQSPLASWLDMLYTDGKKKVDDNKETSGGTLCHNHH